MVRPDQAHRLPGAPVPLPRKREYGSVEITRPEKSWKRYRSWKTLEKSWNSKVVLLKMLFLVQLSLPEKKFIVIHCVHFVTTGIAFGLVYCNAVTSKTDLVCALFDLMQPCL